MKLSDYGIRGPWQVADCDGCGNRRSCLVAQESRGEDVETFAQCVPCIVKDIRAMERAQAEGGEA